MDLVVTQYRSREWKTQLKASDLNFGSRRVHRVLLRWVLFFRVEHLGFKVLGRDSAQLSVESQNFLSQP